MLTKPLTAFANCYNFEILDDCAYGKIGSYLVSVRSNGYKKEAFIAFFAFESEDSGEKLLKYKLSDGLKASSKPALKDYEICEDGLKICTGADLKEFDEAVVEACSIVEKLGFKGADSCTYCGGEAGDDRYVYFDGGKALLLCRDCAEDFLKQREEESAKKSPSGKGRGVVASLLASLISLVVFTAVFAFALPYAGIKDSEGSVIIGSMRFSIIFAAITTVLTFLAYRIFTGRKGMERLLPCGIFSLLSAALTTYFASSLQYFKMFSISFFKLGSVLGTVLAAPFADPYFKKDFLSNLLYSAIVVIGIALVYSIVFEDKKKPEAFLVRFGSAEKLTSVEPPEETEAAEEQ